jgi:excisionase family DNA binding protein
MPAIGKHSKVEALDAPVGASHPDASADAAAAADPGEDVMNVEAVARLLRVGRNTVYILVSTNQIPHRRLRKQIRFSRTAIMRWLASWSSQGAKEGQ